jgi:hypothetical protein
MEFAFVPPTGAMLRNPTKKFLKDLIFNKPEAYWNQGTGCGDLLTSDNILVSPGGTVNYTPNTRGIGLRLKEPFGFLLLFSRLGEEEEVAIRSKDYSQITSVNLGGGPWKIPTAFFVSKDLAWKAVEDFLDTGERSKGLEWVRVADQRW